MTGNLIRRHFIGLAAAAIASALVGAPASAADTPETDTLTISIGPDLPFLVHIVAKEKGWFAEAGFNVVCDKPMTFDLAQAEELIKVVEKSGVVFAVSHNYTGHPLVRGTTRIGL